MTDKGGLQYVERKVRQALSDELHRGGMRAGLPKVTLPTDQVEYLLRAMAQQRQDIEALREQVVRLKDGRDAWRRQTERLERKHG